MTAPSLSSMSPPVEVDPPEFTPYRYGLLSAAQRVDEGGRWELGGVTYTTTGCPNGTQEWVTRCPTDPPSTEPAPEKDIPTGLDEVVGKPFMLYDAVACYPQSGRTEAELINLAVQNLVAGEQEKVEEKFWAQMRAEAVAIAPPTGSTAWPFLLGIGALEHRLAQSHGGIGVLHAPRFLIATAVSTRVARHVGDQLLDPGDDPWAFGAGYDTNGPAGSDPAPAGTAWIYATGPVVLRRASISQRSAFDTHNNERRALAERSYVLTVECPVFAVLVTIPER
jgi:hypothetical protein